MSAMERSQQDIFEKNLYDITSLEDEIRADLLCDRLLKACGLHLMEHHRLSAEEASRLCYGASYFLREYLIPDRRVNLFELQPRHIRQFAGNWYIVKNLEPNLTELTGMLEGVLAFHSYCHSLGLVSGQQAETIQASCADLDYYQSRIESFFAIENDGYFQWLADCPLDD
ncbi:MAG: hypothetical protein P8X63_10470 [Desulfuromonadaceae bacterium]